MAAETPVLQWTDVRATVQTVLRIDPQQLGDEEWRLLAQELSMLAPDQHSNRLEQVLVDHFSSAPGTEIVVDRLIASWRQLQFACKQGQAPALLLRELCFILLSYLGLVLAIPSLFPQPLSAQEAGPAILLSRLTSDNMGLIRELVDRFVGEEGVPAITENGTDDNAPSSSGTLQDIFEPIIAGLVRKCVQGDILGRDLLPNLDMFQTLLQLHPAMVSILLGSSLWRGPYTAPMISQATFLGGLLGLGVDPRHTGPLRELLPVIVDEKITEQELSSAATSAQVVSAMYALRTALDLVVGRLHGLLLFIIKSSSTAKEAVLSWWAWLASANGERLKLHVREEAVSDDRLLVNMFVVLLRFCGPFLRAPEKLSLIDPAYYWRAASRIDVTEATKNNATAVEYDNFLQEYREGQTARKGGSEEQKSGGTTGTTELFLERPSSF